MKPRAEAVLEGSGMQELARHEFVHIRYPRHIDYDPVSKEPMVIVCRGCGTKIAGWVDDDVHEQRVDKLDDRNIVTKMVMRQKFARLASCAQLRLLLDNNALYEPLVCRDCAVGVTREFAQELYLSDMIELVAEAMARAKDPDRAVNIVRVLAARRVEVV